MGLSRGWDDLVFWNGVWRLPRDPNWGHENQTKYKVYELMFVFHPWSSKNEFLNHHFPRRLFAVTRHADPLPSTSLSFPAKMCHWSSPLTRFPFRCLNNKNHETWVVCVESTSSLTPKSFVEDDWRWPTDDDGIFLPFFLHPRARIFPPLRASATKSSSLAVFGFPWACRFSRLHSSCCCCSARCWE